MGSLYWASNKLDVRETEKMHVGKAFLNGTSVAWGWNVCFFIVVSVLSTYEASTLLQLALLLFSWLLLAKVTSYYFLRKHGFKVCITRSHFLLHGWRFILFLNSQIWCSTGISGF